LRFFSSFESMVHSLKSWGRVATSFYLHISLNKPNNHSLSDHKLQLLPPSNHPQEQAFNHSLSKPSQKQSEKQIHLHLITTVIPTTSPSANSPSFP
jgi:hypothetical protein